MGTTYYFLPTRNLFGEDSVKETGDLMKSLGGKKALIVTDAFLEKRYESSSGGNLRTGGLHPEV